jgi:hypothetical protein
MTTPFSPDAKGWVVRSTNPSTGHVSWWYGPDRGWGTTYGPLDHSVAVWRTKREATNAARLPTLTVEKVADAVAFAIAECDRRKEAVLAGDRPDRQSIADANDQAKAYLKGEAAQR